MVIRCHNPGTYPTFIVDDRWVIKFFGELFNGPDNFKVERDANQLVTADGRISAPALRGQGNLLEAGQGWRWPYFIFDFLPGVSLGDAFEHICAEDKHTLAQQLGTLARHLHGLDLSQATALKPTWKNYAEMLRRMRSTCVERQCAWHVLPAPLIEQIETYVPPAEALLHPQAKPVLLHGDITGDHVLGGEREGHWVMQGLIDFGDAMAGDPAYELIPLHLDAFRCDKRLLNDYLDAYGVSAAAKPALLRQAMCLTLVFQFNVLGIVFQRYPHAAKAQTLEKLANWIWNPDAPGLLCEE
jgi:Ser/Thr protein kinase RdoA (MazF antagonist)